MFWWLNYNIDILNKFLIKYTYLHERNYLKLYLKNSQDILLVLNILKLHTNFRYNILVDLVCIDTLKTTNRFILNYILLSIDSKSRLVLSVNVNNTFTISSVTSLFSSANWMEREVWDLFGIFFYNHMDLRRILTDYGFNGYPFRKDFPLNGFFEIRYDEDKQYLVYEPIELMQNMRYFDFLNPFYKKNYLI